MTDRYKTIFDKFEGLGGLHIIIGDAMIVVGGNHVVEKIPAVFGILSVDK